MMYFCQLVFVFISLVFIVEVECFYPNESSRAISIHRIAFGSCNRPTLPQIAWKSIAATNPDLFIWLGDTIYADKRLFLMYFGINSMEEAKNLFMMQKNNTEYASFSSNFPIVGTWDDHDSCANDCGIDCKERFDMQPLFLDFMDEPISSKRRNRRNRAIFESYDFVNPDRKQQHVKLILLDNRSSRTEPITGDMLGEEQWEWFETELRTSKASVHLIASGIQFIPVDKPVIEKWFNHPLSYSRLFELLEKYKIPGVIFLSGDVHLSELFRTTCSKLGYPLYEFTSSGLTHSCQVQVPFGQCHALLQSLMLDRFRLKSENSHPALISHFQKGRYDGIYTVSPSLASRNDENITSGILKPFPKFINYLAWEEIYDVQSEFLYGEQNFGLIEIDWNVGISLQSRRAIDGKIMFEEVIPFEELQPGWSVFDQCEEPQVTWRNWSIIYYYGIFNKSAILGSTIFTILIARYLSKYFSNKN